MNLRHTVIEQLTASKNQIPEGILKDKQHKIIHNKNSVLLFVSRYVWQN